ncbi:MAG: glycoside hydrolase family 5 protein [Phenylobacterium sp.]
MPSTRDLRSLATALAAALLALTAGMAHAAERFAPVDPFVQVREMRRGMNILGYDPFWKPAGQARFHDRHMTIIHQGGFDTVRVGLAAFSHMDAENRLDPLWLQKLDAVIDAATKAHLNVILDEHDFNDCGKDLTACRPRLLAFWRQVGERYSDAPASVMFELLNEPNRQLTPQAWNDLMHELVAVVRATNPTRNLVIGPASWNNMAYLKDLDLPEADRHIIVTIHYYEPMTFTHQGARWNPQTAQLSGVTWGSDAEVARVATEFDGAQAWARAHRRPILLGEFGTYDKADMASRVRYTAAVARAAETRGWAWAYWQFDSDFIAWDMAKDQWVEPIHKALIP